MTKAKRERQLDSWRPGSCASVQPDNEDEGSEADGRKSAGQGARAGTGGQQRAPSLRGDI